VIESISVVEELGAIETTLLLWHKTLQLSSLTMKVLVLLRICSLNFDLIIHIVDEEAREPILTPIVDGLAAHCVG